MKLRLLHFLLILPGLLLSSCLQKGEGKIPEKPVRLVKTVPDIYFSRYDPHIRIIHDTVYLDNGLFSGILIEQGSGNDTVFRGSYFNGVEEGRHIRRYANGGLMEERNYINGGKDGLQCGWWPDGTPKFRFTCYGNEPEGKLEEWNDSGVLIRQFNYRDGYESGAQKSWWDDGKVRANYVVKNGRRYGLIGLQLCSNPYDSIAGK